MRNNTTTEELENTQKVIEQASEQTATATATKEQAAEDISDALASLVADGEVILTADTREALNEKFGKVKTAAFDKRLAAGAIGYDIDDAVYSLQVNAID